ncbi:MAG: AIR synthase-related protein, partial [Alphaproteobacteria bacterium]
GARAGDVVWLSGELGAAHLGLLALRGGARGGGGEIFARAGAAEVEACISRYRCPEPRLSLGVGLSHHASAGLDVSDGLLADGRHIADASGVSLELELERLPLCSLLRSFEGMGSDKLLEFASGGDDYELLFTVTAAASGSVERVASEAGVGVTAIGRVVERGDRGVIVRDTSGAEMNTEGLGWSHF